MSTSIDVHGGAGGIVANCEALEATAKQLGALGASTAVVGAAANAVVVDPAMVAPAFLDPTGAARFTLALADALDGPAGVISTGLQIGLLDIELCAAADAYRATDAVLEALTPTVDALKNLPGALWQLVQGNVQGALTEDPDIAVITARSLVGPLLERYTEAAILADGDPVVTRTGGAATQDAAGPPRSVSALVDGLAQRGSGANIDVRILEGPGPRRVIVDIPGTESWNPVPGGKTVADPGTNVAAIEGAKTTYQRGVIEALRQAGVSANDDVMLVGHSQGGMVAVTTAQELSATGEFHVSHVITAGSPVGMTVGRLPANVQVLALENRADLVPALDSTVNPDLPNVTTVIGDVQRHNVGEDHDLRTGYLPIADQLPDAAVNSASIASYLEGMKGFLNAQQVHTQTFHIDRAKG